MDDFTSRAVRDERDGYALLQARRRGQPKAGKLAPDFELDRDDGSEG